MSGIQSIISTFKQARELDKAIWTDEKRGLFERAAAQDNANGRKFIIGSISGALRVVNSLAKIAFALIGAAFCLVGAALSCPFMLNKNKEVNLIPIACLYGAAKCGEYAINKVKCVARGVVEIVPFTGYALAKYDIEQHQKRQEEEHKQKLADMPFFARLFA